MEATMSSRRGFLSLLCEPLSQPPVATENDDGAEISEVPAAEEDRWGRMLPELLGEIMRRVESSGDRWPLRRNVVSCAGVCRGWRDVTAAVVPPPHDSGKITFPLSVKQPGTRDLPIECFIKRNKKNSTFYLYLNLTQTSQSRTSVEEISQFMTASHLTTVQKHQTVA